MSAPEKVYYRFKNENGEVVNESSTISFQDSTEYVRTDLASPDHSGDSNKMIDADEAFNEWHRKNMRWNYASEAKFAEAAFKAGHAAGSKRTKLGLFVFQELKRKRYGISLLRNSQDGFEIGEKIANLLAGRELKPGEIVEV